MGTVLVVDDDRTVTEMVSGAIGDEHTVVLTASDVAKGLEVLAEHRPKVDVCLLDIMLPDTSGLEAFEEFQRVDARLPIIYITSDSSSDTAIEAMKKGAFDYILKPLDLPAVKAMVGRAISIRRKMLVPVQLATDVFPEESSDAIIGNSLPMQTLYKAIGRVAPQDVTVLICGDSGTGKELVARAIYHHSLRSQLPFLAVNCAAIPETLLESELFGHEKGAFTGADRRRIGKFEQCSGGTIFLDEIGDMPHALQSKILRLLQSQQFERLGGNETIQTDVRIIAATNRNLESLVKRNQFREDLYYRLRGFIIRLPALRDRGADITLLVRHFLARFNRELGKNVGSIAPEAMEVLTSHSWPGNVRELENVIKQTLVQATGSIIVPEFLPPLSTRGMAEAPPRDERHDALDLDGFIDACIRADSGDLYARSLEYLERRLLTRVLQKAAGNQSQAARILGITRGSLRNKIRALGIEIERIVNVEMDAIE
ncbi:MAG: sigma-54 dependent transcriptional regulator [Planctomycetes bacterium]|nr:sigma-54 dependent transcriptional regulator [Planctomycetota bacterium]